MKDIILYGCGRKCEETYMLLRQSNVHIKGVIDSNPNKWGMNFHGVSVSSPDTLYEAQDSYIYITIRSIRGEQEVRNLLREKYGKDAANRELSYYNLILYVYQNLRNGKIADYLKDSSIPTGTKAGVLFDCYSGLVLGGIEEWTKNLCSELIQAGWNNIGILTDQGQYDIPVILQNHIEKIEVDYNNLYGQDNILNMIQVLRSQMPCVVVTSKLDPVLMAACILKQYFPGKIKIISVIHVGHELNYRCYSLLNDWVDLYINVAEEISAELVSRGVAKEKILNMTCPVKCEEVLERTYTENGKEPVHIGYAGRIEVSQKRMDLMSEMLVELDSLQVNYQFEFAGDGSYRDTLKEFVRQNRLEDRVYFLGKLHRDEMPAFWKRQDICVNIADSEARCISKMEAMANGAVPIVTDTVGMREDITDEESGFIVPIGGYQEMAWRIRYLDQHRELLKRIGKKAYESIFPKCQMKDHLQFWENVLTKYIEDTKRHFLFGAAKFCEQAIEKRAIDLNQFCGIFDNKCLDEAEEKFGLPKTKPYYDPDIDILITVRSVYHMEIIRQILELGYRRFSILFMSDCENQYFIKNCDYTELDYERDKDKVILLFLEHRSYSGITAIQYMFDNQLIDTGEYKVKMFRNDPNDSNYYYDLLTAKYFITERIGLGDRTGNLKSIQLWHGFPLKTLEHMAKSYKGDKKSISNIWKEYDFIISYGQNYTNFMCACYGSLNKQFVPIGMPRNDLLYVTDGKGNIIKIMPDAEGRKIILYMPTFREIESSRDCSDDGDEDGYIFYWNDFSVSRLEKFCRENEAYFIFKLHPSDASKAKSWYAESQYIGIMTDEMLGEKCMYEYLNAADVLITDYSSVYFDYLLLDRPIVFADKDIDTYEQKRGFMLEPLKFWRPGISVQSYEVLERELTKVLSGSDAYRQARHDLIPFVHKYQDGNSTQRLFDFIIHEIPE